MKRKTIGWAAALAVTAIAAAVFVSGALNPNVYLRITNDTDGQVYGYWMYYSYQGRTGREAEAAQGVSKPGGTIGDNTHTPFAVGEGVKVTMRPSRTERAPASEELTVELYVFDRPIRTAGDQALENAARVGVITLPAKTGRCAEIVVTGSREDGYQLAFAGFANWMRR